MGRAFVGETVRSLRVEPPKSALSEKTLSCFQNKIPGLNKNVSSCKSRRRGTEAQDIVRTSWWEPRPTIRRSQVGSQSPPHCGFPRRRLRAWTHGVRHQNVRAVKFRWVIVRIVIVGVRSDRDEQLGAVPVKSRNARPVAASPKAPATGDCHQHLRLAAGLHVAVVIRKTHHGVGVAHI